MIMFLFFFSVFFSLLLKDFFIKVDGIFIFFMNLFVFLFFLGEFMVISGLFMLLVINIVVVLVCCVCYIFKVK